MTHVASLKREGEVLLMTCWVKVITPDALLRKPGPYLTARHQRSWFQEDLVYKRLWLPCCCSNSKINGVFMYWWAPERYCKLQVSWSTKWGEVDRGGSLRPSQGHCKITNCPGFLSYQVETLVRSGVWGPRLLYSSSGGHAPWRKGL